MNRKDTYRVKGMKMLPAFLWVRYAFIIVACNSCAFDSELCICPYSTRLEYWYAGNSSENVLPLYVNNMQQYLFDAEGRLLDTQMLRGDSLTQWDAKLPPGNYTVVVWGNIENSDVETDGALTEGKHRLSELTLSAIKEGVPPGFRGNTGRLYYGTASFTVEEGKVSGTRVYLAHAHAALSVTVRWMVDEERPPADGNYRMQLKNIPALYNFIKGWEAELPSGDGVFAIPAISNNTLTRHETKAVMTYDEEVVGEFVTFRYTGNTHQLWSLWRNDRQIVKELDLYNFFSTLPMDMDLNIKQEFDILVTIYKDKITVSFASASDWDEGGTIG